MQIMNTFVAKIGPAGKRNRAARRKQARVTAYHQAHGHRVNSSRGNEMLDKIRAHRKNVSLFTDDVTNEDFGLKGSAPGVLNIPSIVKVQEKLDLSGNWDENIARKALEMFATSGKSQRSFAAEFNFPESRLRSWKKKLETSAV